MITIGEVVGGDLPPLPEEHLSLGYRVSLKPEGLSFNSPAVIRIPLPEEEWHAWENLVSKEDFKLVKYNHPSHSWVVVPIHVDDIGVITAEISGFSVWDVVLFWKPDNPASREKIEQEVRRWMPDEDWEYLEDRLDRTPMFIGDEDLTFAEAIGCLLLAEDMWDKLSDGNFYAAATVAEVAAETLPMEILQLAVKLAIGMASPLSIVTIVGNVAIKYGLGRWDTEGLNAQVRRYLSWRGWFYTEEGSWVYQAEHDWGHDWVMEGMWETLPIRDDTGRFVASQPLGGGYQQEIPGLYPIDINLDQLFDDLGPTLCELLHKVQENGLVGDRIWLSRWFKGLYRLPRIEVFALDSVLVGEELTLEGVITVGLLVDEEITIREGETDKLAGRPVVWEWKQTAGPEANLDTQRLKQSLILTTSGGYALELHAWDTLWENHDSASVAITVVGGASSEEIWDWYDLDAIRNNLGGNFVLMNNLDSSTAGYAELASETANDGKGWQPVGNRLHLRPFTGTFNGQGYEIRDLFIDRSDVYCTGLFGVVEDGGVIENVGLVNTTVSGFYYTGGVTGSTSVGGLVGWNEGTVSNSYSSGSVAGYYMVGGIVGANDGGIVSDCYSTSSVTGDWFVGGLVGWNFGTMNNSHSSGSVAGESEVGGLVGFNSATVTSCYSTSSVTGDYSLGGLVGWNFGTVSNSYSSGNAAGHAGVGGLVGHIYQGTVSNSYSTGCMTGENNVGGLIGTIQGGTVSNSYANGSVNGHNDVGGLVGDLYEGTVSDCYCSGSVTGDECVGGLVGNNRDTVSNSYSIGSVTGAGYLVGGLVGNNPGTVRNSFWDIETSGQATSGGGMGKTTAEMHDIATFSWAGWNIIAVANLSTSNPSYTWNIVDDETYPFLSWQSVS